MDLLFGRVEKISISLRTPTYPKKSLSLRSEEIVKTQCKDPKPYLFKV